MFKQIGSRYHHGYIQKPQAKSHDETKGNKSRKNNIFYFNNNAKIMKKKLLGENHALSKFSWDFTLGFFMFGGPVYGLF